MASSATLEKRALQLAVGVACLVPILAGGAGMLQGPGTLYQGMIGLDLDSHFRYLSGLLLGIGLGFVSTIPRIETHSQRFTLLAGIVVVGGLGRLLALIATGAPSTAMKLALVMELVVTPALALWQRRVARGAP